MKFDQILPYFPYFGVSEAKSGNLSNFYLIAFDSITYAHYSSFYRIQISLTIKAHFSLKLAKVLTRL